MALYGDTGAAAKAGGAYTEPELVSVAASQPEADRRIRRIAAALMQGLGLQDVFSMDFRVEEDEHGASHRVRSMPRPVPASISAPIAPRSGTCRCRMRLQKQPQGGLSAAAST